MNIEQARFNMVEQQIRPWDVPAQDVLDLLRLVKRENFVPLAYRNLAFADIEIPLPCGQNMMAPRFEARILQAAAIKKHESVLEIGTGSGHMAALLAHKARHVTSVERFEELKALAERNLEREGVDNVTLALGNGAQGWNGAGSHCAPYDVIIVSGALPFLPDTFLQQLKPGGRIAAVVGEAPLMTAQVVTRAGEATFQRLKLFETCVTPLLEASPAPHFTF